MERMIIGLEKIEYVSRKTGEQVKGMNLHTNGLSANVKGRAAEQFFVSVKAEGIYPIACALEEGDVVDVQFNRFGSIDSIYKLEEK